MISIPKKNSLEVFMNIFFQCLLKGLIFFLFVLLLIYGTGNGEINEIAGRGSLL